MKKIMPNDKCPCMSGKKYKFCCFKRQEFLKEIKAITGGDYIDTNYILSNATKNLPLLKTYLNKIFPLINMSVIFAVNKDLDANMRSIGSNDKTVGIIVIREAPIKQKDYFDLAHEFGHLLTVKNGYPMVQTAKGVPTAIGTVFTNTIMDPIINRVLYSFGFDFISYLEKGFSIQIPMLKSYPEEQNLDLLQRYFIKCLIIEKELEWDIINENILENKFKTVYHDKYPLAYKEALEFVSYVKEKGIDSPEKVRSLLIKLRADNKMEQYIEIL